MTEAEKQAVKVPETKEEKKGESLSPLEKVNALATKKSESDIEVDEKDIKVVSLECDLTMAAAETLLRSNGGVLKDTLLNFLKR